MNPFEFFEDMQAKQHINLSSYAWDIIEQDNMEFTGQNPDKISGFLNHILEVYLRDGLYPADITSSVLQYEKEQASWIKQISGLTLQQTQEISALLKKKHLHSLSQSFHTPKGIGRKFDINNCCRLLLKEKGDYGYEAEVFKKRGTYLNTIFEHYAKRPMAERENIFYTDMIKDLEYCIQKRQVIHLTSASYFQQLIPYKIMQDNYHMHMYLVAVPYEKQEMQSYLFRISQIKKITKSNITAPVFSKETISTLENEIRLKGVQYLPGETQKIQIQLTPAGKNMYHRITFQRPAYERQTEEEARNNIFTFLCTPYQAFVYFKSFGCEATVLSPVQLREDFINFYRSALNNYHGENT